MSVPVLTTDLFPLIMQDNIRTKINFSQRCFMNGTISSRPLSTDEETRVNPDSLPAKTLTALYAGGHAHRATTSANSLNKQFRLSIQPTRGE